MAVYKYKTFEEAEQALWNFHPDEAHFKRVAELWNFANTICPIHYPQGIFKYRNIAEANKQQDEWERAHARQLRLQRNSTPSIAKDLPKK